MLGLISFVLPWWMFFGLCEGTFCPKECDCDLDKGLNRAVCYDQNIVTVDVGVPKEVQVYSLRGNVISEVENFCFKEIGYSSLINLDLSFNLIFWIGLHAFAGLVQLTNLDLSNNRLSFIPSDVFWDTPKLEILDLSSNSFDKLKNEPFIIHEKLQVLNLNNCRIKSLPERMFSRLPMLKKLDLSENYMITITVAVLKPMKILERLELRNEYWKCNPDFIHVETWILAHNIKYIKQCTKRALQKSQKMISIVVERNGELVDINKAWNITVENETLPDKPVDIKPLTPFQIFNNKVPALHALVFGIEIGLALGIVCTYLCIRCTCSCKDWSRRIRRRRNRCDQRSSLLWNNAVSLDLGTPPPYRRQMALSDRNPPFFMDAIREDRAETPPPPYNECRLNI